MCCVLGKVHLPTIQKPPKLLGVLLNRDHPKSEDFQNNLRAYNSAFWVTSFGAKKKVIENSFMPYVNKISQVY